MSHELRTPMNGPRLLQIVVLGSFSLNVDVLNVPNVIKAVVRNCQPALKAGVELKSTISPGFLTWKEIPCDSRSYKTCRIHREGIYTVNENDLDMYVITTKVVDSGIGVSDTAMKEYQGTGLWLSICKSLAELMDGAVGFHANRVGLGSVFWMTAKMIRISPVAR
ncbi:hypothetical protein N7505_001362 [Penicillium chrysogenum]|uniref:Histidine kinase/HSP90-like ATPase domain-containing protein n=1 Tax=Penicillium chrysogenum TaxID=5076 RepID=A0ABQ8WWZ3_PENCH|nr:hypothetical protein N7505_001362 [Penicillium chrysogenum]